MPSPSPLRAVRTQGDHTEGGRCAARSVREGHVGCRVVVEAEMDVGGELLELRREVTGCEAGDDAGGTSRGALAPSA
jgi:hypothetical protein